MHKFIVVLIFAGLGYLGYAIWEDVEKKRAVPEQVQARPTPTPLPTATPVATAAPTAEPEPEARFAPEGVLFVVKRFNEPHDGGVRGFSPGKEVRLVRQEQGYYVVSDGEIEARRPRSWFTRDIQLAGELRAQKMLSDREIAAYQAREKEAYEASLRTKASQAEAALAARQAALSTQVGMPDRNPVRTDIRPLRLGAWNLEYFGSRNDPPRTEADVQAIADYIRGLDVQVLAVCEINGEKPLEDLVKRIGPGWKFVLGKSGKLGQDGQVAPGVIWDDSRVEMLGAGELTELSGPSASGLIFHRAPVVVAFRDRTGGPDFRVVSVHLKAGRTPEDFDRRRAEGRSLRRFIEELVADPDEDNDIVVLGDFNHSPSADEAEIWQDGGFAGFLKGRGRSIIHFDSQIDQAVPLATFEEIKPGSFTVHNKAGLRNPEQWRRIYSDHFPVTVELEAVPDDDPAATLGAVGKRLR
jgi:hypothetical protein